ncbi:hypothetical protein POTOM_029692 [Populus tomentosa]|uniref:CRAL-TRIO domain-containing protein n=1 Tax=Populus tomentosa TaxID=118781 RepID=A0A8X7ZD78_POPTO|nr:hypothetical protein POTOM_029692 [Populus tomentosa]
MTLDICSSYKWVIDRSFVIPPVILFSSLWEWCCLSGLVYKNFFEVHLSETVAFLILYLPASLTNSQPDLGWMQRLQQILTRKHQKNLHAIYVLHPNFHLKATIFALQVFVDKVTWKKVVYVDRLLQLFRYVPREQLTIPDFVFQHDLEVNGGKGLIVDPRTKYVYHRP